MQTPNDALRQQDHDKICKDLDTGGSEHDLGQLEAFGWQVKLPDRLVRYALEVQKDDAGDSPADLQSHKHHAGPPEYTSRSVGDKDSTPVEQYGDFDQRHSCRIAAAVYENQL